MTPKRKPLANRSTGCAAGQVARLELPPSATLRWALLADPHVAEVERGSEWSAYNASPAVRLEKAIAEVLRARPSAAILLGDLAWVEGREGDYEHLQRLLTPLANELPVVLMLGNHDNRGSFLWTFRFPGAWDEPPPARLIVVLEHPLAKLILLDSLFRTDVAAGVLGKEQLRWLRNELAAEDQRPVLLGVHHPLDEEDDSLLDGDRLLSLVREFPPVQMIFTAHDHCFGCATVDGVRRVGLPALGLAFHEGEPTGWVEAEVFDRGIDLQFHAEGRPQRPLRFPWRH